MQKKSFYESPVSEAITLNLEGVICQSGGEEIEINWGAMATFGEVTVTDVDFTFNF